MKRAPLILSLTALLALGQCKKDNNTYDIGGPDGIPLSDIIRVESLSSLSLEADGVSPCLIGIQLNPNTDSVDQSVIFNSSIGQFPNGLGTDTTRIDAAGVATLPLLSHVTGQALIKATAGGYSVDTTITFTQALPDAMLESADIYTGSSTDSFHITCKLFRNPERGTVTDPVKVLFSVSPATVNNAPALIVPAFAYSQQGIVTVTVQNPYKNPGSFVIQASTTADNGSTLTPIPVTLTITP